MPTFSHSKLSTFEQCPIKYKFRYIDKLEGLRISVESFLGDLVHRALEKLYQDLKFQKINTVEELIGYFSQLWEKEWNDNIVIVRQGYAKENYKQMGIKFITDYYNHYKPFNHSKTIGLEQKVTLDLDSEGKYKLLGYVDRLSMSNGNQYEIHDYKTANNLPMQDYLEKDKQLALYQIAVQKMFPDAVKVELIWHFLAFDKEMRVTKSAEELGFLRQNTIKLIQKIEATTEFPPKVSALCDWCEFKPICPAWKHVYQTDALPVEEFKKDSGVQMVDKYAQLAEKQKEIELQIEELKASMFRLAEKEGFEAIAGSDVVARLKKYKNLKFPGKDDFDRKELEEIIKSAGLWEKLSNLDTFILSKMVQNAEIPLDVIKQLKKFAKIDETKRIYLNKKKEWE